MSNPIFAKYTDTRQDANGNVVDALGKEVVINASGTYLGVCFPNLSDTINHQLRGILVFSTASDCTGAFNLLPAWTHTTIEIPQTDT